MRSQFKNLIYFLLFVPFCAASFKPAQALSRINVDSYKIKNQVFDGFGVNGWPGDDYLWKVVDELKLKYVRFSIGPNWSNLSEHLSNINWNESVKSAKRLSPAHFDLPMCQQMERLFDADGPRYVHAKKFFQEAKKRNIKTVLVQFDIPKYWQKKNWWQAGNELKKEYVENYAILLNCLLGYVKNKFDTEIDFLELSNEPDGDWGIFISPDTYSELVKKTRQLMEISQLQKTQILGPGLAFANRERIIKKKSLDWVRKLDSKALEALGGWSTHLWDENFKPKESSRAVKNAIEAFKNSITQKGPEQLKKKLIVTEYATAATQFNSAQVFSSPEEKNPKFPVSSESQEYAFRVVENTLQLLNQGVNSMLLWQAHDQAWHYSKWGLLRLDGSPRPVMQALKQLIPFFKNNQYALYLEDASTNILQHAQVNAENNQIQLFLLNPNLNSENTLIEINKSRDHAVWVLDSVSGLGVNPLALDKPLWDEQKQNWKLDLKARSFVLLQFKKNHQ